MSPFSRRALMAGGLASLVTACGGRDTTRHDTTRHDATGDDTARRGTAVRGPGAAASPVPSGGARPLARSAPVRLLIPAIGVDTPVIRLGLAGDGTVQVPPVTAHDRAGWYRHSPTPGETGPSVLLGHVTVGPYGDGVFRHLARLHRDDRIVARLENGTAAEFAVTAVRTVPKTAFPADDVYGNVARPELRLITCGGARTGDGYADNVIVFATLSGAKSPTPGER
ncbi:class F sortase [Streptomyces sp. NPDC059696]|uniref:class F sortase n=1 Tax=Streptomyces sp. NPDC059696 TaxID=3346911 RepID=UPI0036B17DB4